MSAPQSREPGKIITFYSYKGGTGRSMALANVAWILASNGYRVLAVDWDLEAPGLHRYFAPFMLDPELKESEGVIDIVSNYVTASMTPPPDNNSTKIEINSATKSDSVSGDSKWYEPFANILRYATSLEWNFPEHEGRKGWLDLIPAGRQGSTYATRMNSFSWQNFYDRLGGGGFIEMVKQRMKEEYDYILIDSRTGVSDTSGICTVQLPDILAVCFTFNRQSIEGAGAVAGSVLAQRRALRVFPIPTRVEKAEKDKLELAREAARDQFEPFMPQSRGTDRDQYWGQVEVFYEPFYAYEEILATFGDKPLQTSSLLASMERITAWLTDQRVTQLVPADESDRQRVIDKCTRQSRRTKTTKPAEPAAGQEYLFYVSYARSDLDEYLERFIDDLMQEVRKLTGARSSEAVGFVDLDIPTGTDWVQHLAQTLQRSRVLIPIFSPAYFTKEQAGKEFQYFLNRSEAAGQKQTGILPVIWVALASAIPLPEVANAIQLSSTTYPDAYNNLGLRSMMRLRRYEDSYRDFVSAFARSVTDLAEHAPRADLPISSFDVLPNAFVPTKSEPNKPTDSGTVSKDSLPDDLRSFVNLIPTLDEQTISDVCESGVIRYIRSRNNSFPVVEGRTLLNNLSRRHLYSLMEQVANEMIVSGQDDAVIRRFYARSLVGQNKMTAALAVLNELSAVTDPSEKANISGLLGRVHKQLYLDAEVPSLPRNQQHLIRAIKVYLAQYSAQPSLLWHGINVVALVLRAARDNIRIADIASPLEYAQFLARRIFSEVEDRVSRGEAAHWDYGVAAEACLAVEDWDGALEWFASYIQDPLVDAFDLSNTLAQLTDVWQLDSSVGIGHQILPLLRAELLKRDGGKVTLTTNEIRDREVETSLQSSNLSKVFRGDSFVTLQWFQTGLERCSAIARIEDKSGALRGTGIVLQGKQLAQWLDGDHWYLVTSAQVLRTFDISTDGALSPWEARISLDVLGLRECQVGRVIFTSSPKDLDITIVSLETSILGMSPIPIASLLPALDGKRRVYVIGHSVNGSLSMSLHDNLLLDYEGSRIHYRASMWLGSSGSPVFNQEWELIGIHHAGSDKTPRLNSKPGTYRANEAIWIGAIQEEIAKPM
jgi:hypothetical protein